MGVGGGEEDIKEAQENKENMNAGFTAGHFTLAAELQVKCLQRKSAGRKSSKSNKDATAQNNDW